jgi:hypothetical protein
MFLKMYTTEEVDASLAGCDEKAVRFWRWEMVKIIAELDVVCSFCTFSLRFVLFCIQISFCDPDPVGEPQH